MAALGKAIIAGRLVRIGGELRQARDDLRAGQRGRLATRVGGAADDLEGVVGVLMGREPEAGQLAQEVAGDLAERAQMYATREVADELLEATVAARMREIVAAAFLRGYAACIDDGKSAATAQGRARRRK